MNSVVKGISEGRGVKIAIREFVGDDLTIILSVGASACKRMLPRTGTGKVKQLSSTQLWVQGAAQIYGMEVQKMPRPERASDVITHPMREAELRQGFRMGYRTLEECPEHLRLGPMLGNTMGPKSLGRHGVVCWGCRHHLCECKSRPCSGISVLGCFRWPAVFSAACHKGNPCSAFSRRDSSTRADCGPVAQRASRMGVALVGGR